MLLSLQKYRINVVYKPGKNVIIADTLSRANLSEKFEDNLDLEAQICLIEKNLVITDERMTQFKKRHGK